MPNLNQCLFIGHLGQDPDVRQSQSGDPIVNISLGVTFHYKDSKQTEWVRGVLFGKRAEFAANFLRKGDAAFIDGRMQTRKWTDREGTERYTTEIVVNNVQKLSPRQAPTHPLDRHRKPMTTMHHFKNCCDAHLAESLL